VAVAVLARLIITKFFLVPVLNLSGFPPRNVRAIAIYSLVRFTSYAYLCR
jgi:hypothetical protein